MPDAPPLGADLNPLIVTAYFDIGRGEMTALPGGPANKQIPATPEKFLHSKQNPQPIKVQPLQDCGFCLSAQPKAKDLP
jgi:hypothetical protein